MYAIVMQMSLDPSVYLSVYPSICRPIYLSYTDVYVYTQMHMYTYIHMQCV